MKKLCLIHIPKTAGSSVHYFLKKTLGKNFINCGHVVTLDEPMPYIERAFVKKIDRKFLNKKKYFTFSIVRNPFDLLVSMYHYGIPYTQFSHFDVFKYVNFPFLNFKDFFQKLVDPKFPWFCPPQKKSLFFQIYKKNINIPDFILYYENIEQNLKQLITDLYGINNFVDFPHNKKSEDKLNYTQYYDKKMINIFYKNFKNDFKIFGYDFENTKYNQNYLIKENITFKRSVRLKNKSKFNRELILNNNSYNDFRKKYRKKIFNKF